MIGKQEFVQVAPGLVATMRDNLVAALIEGLGEAASAIGGGFVHGRPNEEVPDDIKGYLAFSLMLARAEALHDPRSAAEVCRTERDSIGDGYGSALLAEVLSGLARLDLYLAAGPGGWDLLELEARWAALRESAASREG